MAIYQWATPTTYLTSVLSDTRTSPDNIISCWSCGYRRLDKLQNNFLTFSCSSGSSSRGAALAGPPLCLTAGSFNGIVCTPFERTIAPVSSSISPNKLDTIMITSCPCKDVLLLWRYIPLVNGTNVGTRYLQWPNGQQQTTLTDVQSKV